MRKTEYIQKLNYRDERFCYILKNCHHMSREQALVVVSQTRLLAYQHQGLVRKLHYIYQSKQRTAYKLTDKGRRVPSGPHKTGDSARKSTFFGPQTTNGR